MNDKKGECKLELFRLQFMNEEIRETIIPGFTIYEDFDKNQNS